MAAPKASSKIESLLKAVASDREAKPSGLVEHRLDDKGLEMKIFVPRDKLGPGARDLAAFLMSDLM